MRIALLALFVGVLFVPVTLAQRDAPVWEAYLPRLAVYHDQLNNKSALTIDLLFKKNGGPYEHYEHQAYVLMYLKKDEEQILKLAADPQLIKKQSDKTTPLLEALTEKKLVAVLDSHVAKLNMLDERLPSFPDARGNGQRTSAARLEEYTFPFRFTFADETLFQTLNKLGNFQAKDVTVYGPTTAYNDLFKLLLFVPVNDSGYATKVTSKLRETNDFAHAMNFGTVLLYFRPLPYELSFSKYEDKLLLYLN